MRLGIVVPALLLTGRLGTGAVKATAALQTVFVTAFRAARGGR